MAIKKIIEVTDDITGKTIDGSFFGICLEGQRVNHDGDVLCDATLETEDLDFMSTFADITLTRESVLTVKELIVSDIGQKLEELKEQLRTCKELLEVKNKEIEELKKAASVADQTEEETNSDLDLPNELPFTLPPEMIAPPEEPKKREYKSIPWKQLIDIDANGLEPKEIANELKLSKKTVSASLYRIRNGIAPKEWVDYYQSK